MRESYLVNDIMRMLNGKNRSGVCKVHRVNTGSVIDKKTNRRFSTGTPSGYPDISGYLKAEYSISGFAIPVYIEAKVHPNTPSDEQLKFIETVKEDGAIAGVCYSCDDVWDLLIPYIKSPAEKE